MVSEKQLQMIKSKKMDLNQQINECQQKIYDLNNKVNI